MTTIPQRLRDIAFRLRRPRDGRPLGADGWSADLLDAIAAELEAPAADAVPVVAWMTPEESAFSHQEGAHGRGTACTVALIRQRDHLATVAALQARIASLEADQAQTNAAAEFWHSIYADGVSQEELRAELSDYQFLLEQVPKVYDAVTGGRLTKTNYYATVVISEFEDYLTKRCEEEAKENTEELQARISALEARPAWVALTDEDRTRAFQSLPDMLEGFMKTWGWLHFAKAVEAICREKNGDPT